MLTKYLKPDYNHNFTTSFGNYDTLRGVIRVMTDSYGRGHISFKGTEIPINLAGKGESKARKKAIRIISWWINQESALNNARRFHKYVPTQKRASQRARKKTRRAARRSAFRSSYGHRDPFPSWT